MHLTLGEWQRLIELIEQQKAELRAVPEKVFAAFNRAADEVSTAGALAEEPALDAINLVVNAGLHFLREPDGSLLDAIEASYNDAASDVISWIRTS